MRNHMYMIGICTVVATVALGACAEPPTASVERGSPSATKTVFGSSAEDHEIIAAALASALADPAARAALHEAMQNSPWHEEKLLLQEHFRSANGRALFRAAARAVKLDEEAFQAKLDALPAMDLYVPDGAQRAAWTGSETILVGAALDSDGDALVAYDGRGLGRTLRGIADAGSATLVVLHPAEPKFERATVGKLPMMTIAFPNGSATMQTLTSPCQAYPIRMFHYNIQQGDGWFGGDLEMEFRSYWEHSNNPYYYYQSGHKTVAIGGIKEDRGYNVNIVVNDGSTKDCAYAVRHFAFTLHEMDSGGANGEDFYGSRNYGPTPFNQTVDYWNGSGRAAWINIGT